MKKYIEHKRQQTSLITGLIRCRTSDSPGDAALNSKMLKPPRQQITGQLCNHAGHQEMRIIYTGTSWGCAIKSHLRCLEIIPLLCPGNLCQSVGGAAFPSPVPLSSSAALNLCCQRFADAAAQRHTCYVCCALSFPASLEATSLRIHFSVPSNYPLLRQELGDKLRCD